MIWDDSFQALPVEPRYVIQKPYGSRPFSLLPAGGLRVKYTATKYDGKQENLRAEIQPRTDPYNEVGIRLLKGQVLNFNTAIRIPTTTPVQSAKIVLMQWYQRNGLNPPGSLELVRDEFRYVRLYSFEDPGTTNPATREVLFRWKCVRGVWYDFDLTASFAPDETGVLQFSVDGELHDEWYGPNCYNCEENILPKAGVYRPGVKDGTVKVGSVTTADFRRLVIW